MKIKELGKTVTGKTPSTKDLDNFNGEIPFVTPDDISSGFLITKTKRTLSEKGFASIYNNTIDGVSVIVGCIGNVGDVAICNGRCATNQQINAITQMREQINPYYVYYALKTKHKVFNNAAGTTVLKILPKSVFDEIDIEIPSLYIQTKIAAALTDIDSKIANNNAINTELEAMAKTIYDYWFLQFEFPDENGKPYKSSGGKMVYNEELKREIPKGWEVETLIKNRLTKVIKPGVKSFSHKNYLATANIVGEEISDGEWISYENRESRANMQPIAQSVWFAKMKNSVKHLTLPSSCEWFVDKYILSTGFLGLSCDNLSLTYIHCFINNNAFEPLKDRLAHGATQEAVNNEDLKSIKLVIPSEHILSSFAKIVNPILQKKLDLVRENQELASLRDFLLPLLMNGQVGFKETY